SAPRPPSRGRSGGAGAATSPADAARDESLSRAVARPRARAYGASKGEGDDEQVGTRSVGPCRRFRRRGDQRLSVARGGGASTASGARRRAGVGGQVPGRAASARRVLPELSGGGGTAYGRYERVWERPATAKRPPANLKRTWSKPPVGQQLGSF